MTDLLWSLIALQMAMGGFDVLYHHELTERLAWRASQARELRLHAVRNLFYALLFLTFAWSEPHGALALIVLGLLAAEVVVTLADFVEEDRSRRLPASERVTHTLLALNYGAVLMLLCPLLLAWTRRPVALVATSHGYWSLMASAAAMGVGLFAARDFAAAGRSPRLALPPAAPLAAGLAGRRRILVSGATGFIGARLVEALAGAGHEVTVLVRNAGSPLPFPPPYRVITDLAQVAAGADLDAIVNLAGEPISNGLWTLAKRRRILRSRLRMTREVVRLAARLERRPEVLVSGSAVGWYGLRGDEALDETHGGRPCFSRRLCVAWESMAARAEAHGVRVVRLRTGLVLAVQGGMLGELLVPFEFGLGGPIGSGRQWMSWIARDDLVRLIVHAIATPSLDGPVNAVAPAPVRNADFARVLGRALHRPALLAAPAWLMSRAAGAFADELLLGGQRIAPAKALASGFNFEHPDLPGALQAMVGGGERVPVQRRAEVLPRGEPWPLSPDPWPAGSPGTGAS